jgi:signal transduction histidine kinase/CHASE3 domain sensor protein
MRARSTAFLISILLTAVLAVVAVNTWLAFRSVELLSANDEWVNHTWQVISTLDTVVGLMKDAESGNRGYLLTGDESYLEPYQRAVRNLPSELDSLQHLTSDNSVQQQHIIELRAIIETRLHLLAAGIDARRAGETDSVNVIVNSGAGNFEMGRLRSLVGTMRDEERHLLIQRKSKSAASARRARFTVVTASLLDLMLIVCVFWYLVRERRLRQVADITAARLSKLQYISDVALTQLTASDLTDELLDRLRQVIDADSAIFCTWREGEIEVTSATGVNIPRGLRLTIAGDDPIRRAVEENRAVTVANTRSHSHSLRHLSLEDRALLILPLTVAGHVTAVLIAGRVSSNAFEDQDQALLSVVADRIALALDRANAYEAEREARMIAEKSATEVQQLNAELEERVRARTADLQAINKELEAFSYSVSHDLRAPLRTVDGFSLALEEDFAALLNDDGRDFVRRIRAGVQRMGLLIDSLLQLSRITRAELSREPVNLSELASDVARDLTAQNCNRHIALEIEPDLQTEGDSRLLRVALENLFGNAIKFSARKPQAHIEFGRNPETGEFFLRDNGAGFDMQYAGKLFTAFQRLHGEKDFSGSGIGLATVARVVRRHHGHIRAEGSVDSGATFWFTLG